MVLERKTQSKTQNTSPKPCRGDVKTSPYPPGFQVGYNQNDEEANEEAFGLLASFIKLTRPLLRKAKTDSVKESTALSKMTIFSSNEVFSMVKPRSRSPDVVVACLPGL